MEENERQIPHSTDAEKSVLGSILLSSVAAEKALEVLQAADFYSIAHRDIFTAMEKLYNAGKLIDTVTLMDMLEKLGKLDSAGGLSYISELALYTPSPSNIDHYIKIVENHSVRRRLMSVGAEITQDAVENTKDTEAIVESAERRIYDIARRKSSDSMELIGSVYSRVYTQIGEFMQMDGKPISRESIRSVSTYLILYVFLVMASVLLVSLDNFDGSTTLTAVLATFNNIGPGLGLVGPTGSFAAFSPLSKIVLCLDMLFGRLELYPMLVLFCPSTWKRK